MSPIGKMFSGGRNGREISDVTESVTEGKRIGTGKTGADDDKGRRKGTKNKLSARETAL
jgi:hypothetical protein